MLARREHSREELERKLLGRGFPADEVEEQLVLLIEEGALSERRYAESFVQSHYGRGDGPLKIRHQLSARGVPEALIDDALADELLDWQGQAESVRAKKFGVALPKSYEERGRQSRFLAQRGFSAEQVRRVLGGRTAED